MTKVKLNEIRVTIEGQPYVSVEVGIVKAMALVKQIKDTQPTADSPVGEFLKQLEEGMRAIGWNA